MKIIRVLVYEGEPEELREHLRHRGVKGRSPWGWNRNKVTIREAFNESYSVENWLREEIDEADMVKAAEAAASLPPDYRHLLSEALSLMDTPEQHQDDNWYERRKALEDALA